MNGSGASPKAQDIAQHLIAYEAIGEGNTDMQGAAAFHVCEKLRQPLITLAGTAGFRSLLVRALTLAKREDPGLDCVQIKDDGSLDGLACGTIEPCETLLIAQLLGLLMTFIGEALTMRLLYEIWPDLTGMELHPGERKTHD